MKSIIFFFSVLFSFPLMAQVVGNDKMNVVYAAIDNPLTIASFGFECEDVQLESNFGKLTKIDCDKYIFYTDSFGLLIFTLTTNKGGKKSIIGTSNFRVKSIPDIIAKIGGKKSGTISIKSFKVQVGVAAQIENIDINVSVRILEFNYTFYRNNEILFQGKNNDAKFDETFNKEKLKLLPGDKVVISNITCITPDKKTRNVQPIELILQE